MKPAAESAAEKRDGINIVQIDSTEGREYNFFVEYYVFRKQNNSK
jgi:hypothetical protein